MPSVLRKTFLLSNILTSVLPVLVMIALIPLVQSDIALTAIYTCFIVVTLAVRQNKKDLVFLAAGLVIPTVGEILFVATGVEIFTREVLIAGIPVWLPLLWGYVFIMMRRGITAIEKYVH